MTADDERMLALGVRYFIPYLEGKKAAALGSLIGAFRSGEDLLRTAAELVAYEGLISDLRARAAAAHKKQNMLEGL